MEILYVERESTGKIECWTVLRRPPFTECYTMVGNEWPLRTAGFNERN